MKVTLELFQVEHTLMEYNSQYKSYLTPRCEPFLTSDTASLSSSRASTKLGSCPNAFFFSLRYPSQSDELGYRANESYGIVIVADTPAGNPSSEFCSPELIQESTKRNVRSSAPRLLHYLFPFMPLPPLYSCFL